MAEAPRHPDTNASPTRAHGRRRLLPALILVAIVAHLAILSFVIDRFALWRTPSSEQRSIDSVVPDNAPKPNQAPTADLNAIREQLLDNDLSTQSRGRERLATRGRDIMRQFLDDPDPRVRTNTIKAIIATYGQSDDLDLILTRADDPDPLVRVAVLDAIRFFGSDARCLDVIDDMTIDTALLQDAAARARDAVDARIATP